MLRYLRIQNFKIWEDTGPIRMAPLTLFFGANSSGKSSIGQFLMMLKQTVESPDRRAVFYPGDRNSAVQLGSYQEMIFGRNPDKKIAFEYQWTLQDPLKFKDPLKVGDPTVDQYFSGDEISFMAEVGLGDKDQHPLMVNHLEYQVIEKNDMTMAISMKRKAGTKGEYKVDAEKYSLKRKLGRGWSPGVPVRFYGFPDEVVAYHQNADFVQDLNLEHEKFFRLLSYLGPLRTKAERLYSWTGVMPESVGYAGEHAVAAMLAAKGRKISLRFKGTAKSFEEVIALGLKKMRLIEAFKVTAISEQRQEYEVKIQTKGSRNWVDLPDVGVGISQVLPVLVQCFYAPPGSIILMEQPEIHLHPSAQSALADVLIDVINSREKGAARNIQLIIETHSEHFLRRLQRRIAEDNVPQNKVTAYFADITKPRATLEPLELDQFGNILNWPENFFGDEMGDITAHATAGIEKRMKISSSKSEVRE